MQQLHLDLIGPLPVSTSGDRYILQIKDNFSRFIKLEPIKSKHATSVIYPLLKFIGTFGVPHAITTDNGKEFKNKLDEELNAAFGIRRRYTSAFHPAGNGVAERTNRSIHQIISSYVHEDKGLSSVLASNSSVHRAIYEHISVSINWIHALSNDIWEYSKSTWMGR